MHRNGAGPGPLSLKRRVADSEMSGLSCRRTRVSIEGAGRFPPSGLAPSIDGSLSEPPPSVPVYRFRLQRFFMAG
jgi:hypothetical protein